LANSYALLEELIRTNNEVAAFQKEKLRELSIKDFPFSDSQSLIEALTKVNNHIITKLNQLRKDVDEINSRVGGRTPKRTQIVVYERIRKDLLKYKQLVWSINELVHIVEQSTREYVSQSTVFLVSHLTEKYKNNSSFFLTPIFEHNFAYQDLGKYLQELVRDVIPEAATEIASLLNENFSILSFPDIYRDNIVGNISLAHEVGHFVINVENLVAKIIPNVMVDFTRFSEYVDGFVQQPSSQIASRDAILEERLQFLLSLLKNWIQELLADMIGFYLSGPVFLFSLTEVILSTSAYDHASDRYPPSSYRLELILKEIKKKQFINKIADKYYKDRISDHIQSTEKYLLTLHVQHRNTILEIAFDAVRSVENLIRSIADAVTSSMHQYTPDDFGGDVCKLIGKLEQVIPPAETERGTPANIISILNAGMIYKRIWIDKTDVRKQEVIEQTEHTINALVLRSIEMSVLHSMMKDAWEKENAARMVSRK
jgi:hypothetical protein